MPKPGDFYVTVIDFFGVLLPGAVLTWLYGETAMIWMSLPPFPGSSAAAWPAFLVVSYIAGQFLLNIGAHLNNLLRPYKPKDDSLYEQVRSDVNLPATSGRKDTFYRAHAYLTLESPQAIAEIARHMAEYKLFRGLTLVFAFDCVVALLTGMSRGRWLGSLILTALSFWRFAFLLLWTYRTTFEYYILTKLQGHGKGGPNRQQPGEVA